MASDCDQRQRSFRRARYLFDRYQLAEAERIVSEALKCKQNRAEDIYLAAEIAIERGQTTTALTRYQQAIELDPGNSDYHFSMANALESLGQSSAAIVSYNRALALSPEDHESHNNLANCYERSGEIARAEDHFARAIQLAPENFSYQLNLAACLQANHKHARAISTLRKVLSRDRNNAVVRFKLAVCHQEIGNLRHAAMLLQQALRIKPDLGIAGLHLSRIVKDKKVRKLIHHALVQLAMENKPAQKIYWHFTLGTLYTRLDEFDESFFHYAEGNRMKSAECGFDPDRHAKYIESLRSFFDQRFFESTGSSDLAERPIFIVGMPRSGSTLVEQILSCHPQVLGIGEHPAMKDLVTNLKTQLGAGELYPAFLNSFSEARYGALAAEYRARTRGQCASSGIITCDKMLGNFLRLGLIVKMFPNAVIVHAKRNAMDCCWSSYTQLFERGMHFTYDLDHLGEAYVQYERIMTHWKQTLPVPIFEVRYEEMVRDPESVTQRLLNHCGLEWDAACLSPQSNPRAVRTASYWQIRKPVYRSSVGKYLPYIDYLVPLRTKLDQIETTKQHMES